MKTINRLPRLFLIFLCLITLVTLTPLACSSSPSDTLTFSGSGMREITRSFTVNHSNWKISWTFEKEREAGGLEIAVFETTPGATPPPGTPQPIGPSYGNLGQEKPKAMAGGFYSPGESIIGPGGTFYLRVDSIALKSWQIKVQR
jgi:hypothetical protein